MNLNSFKFKTCLALLCLLFTEAGTAVAAEPVKCTSTSDLVAGEIYYISGASTYSPTATVMGLNYDENYFRGSTFEGTPCELILEGVQDDWTFKYVDGATTYYLDPTDAENNYLKRKTSSTKYGKFTISFTNGAAIITSNVKKGKNYYIIRYNNNHGNDTYSCYTSGQSPVYLYKKVATVPLNAACHDAMGKVYGTYSNASAWVVPSELTVSEVGVDGEGRLNVVSYQTGDVVPANTGVMVSASAGGDYTVALSNQDGADPKGVENCLHPSSEDMIGDNLFYRLTMHNGTQIGFWWGAADGAAFSLAANKAYLAVPKSAQAKATLWLDMADEDALNSPLAQPLPRRGEEIFNLQGQRIRQMQSGVNIVNGKKVLK